MNKNNTYYRLELAFSQIANANGSPMLIVTEYKPVDQSDCSNDLNTFLSPYPGSRVWQKGMYLSRGLFEDSKGFDDRKWHSLRTDITDRKVENRSQGLRSIILFDRNFQFAYNEYQNNDGIKNNLP